MVKVITYGTYDLLHHGHLRLLERAKNLGDYLIVGVTADDFDKARGKINVQQSLEERVAAVQATGLADRVIIEEYEGQKIDDIRKYGVDIFTVGSDWAGCFDYLSEYCQVIYLPRTEGISSSGIRAERSSLRLGMAGYSPFLKKFFNESQFVNAVDVVGVAVPEEGLLGELKDKVEVFTDDYDELLKYVYHRDEYQGFAYMWNKLYKRKLLYDDNYRLIKFDENLMLGGDIVYLAEILMNVDKAVYIDRPFYHYRQRMESGSHSQNVYARIDSLTAYDHVIALFQKNSVSETILKFVKRFQVYHSTNIAEIAFETQNAEALNICHDYMKRYETEYVETNQGHQDRLERFYRIQKYKL